MPVPYKPLAIANEFILKAGPNGAEHMKLQKLVYISYGWWSAFQPSSLCDESPQVWRHGPVFSSLYSALKTHGRAPICHVQSPPFGPAPRVDESDEQVGNLLDWVWERYGDKGAFYLSDLTHQEDTPWQTVAKRYNFSVPMHTAIPDAVIRDHYKKLAKEAGFGD